jgi:hypothetical protein
LPIYFCLFLQYPHTYATGRAQTHLSFVCLFSSCPPPLPCTPLPYLAFWSAWLSLERLAVSQLNFFKQLGFDSPLFVTLLYLLGQSLSLIVYIISAKIKSQRHANQALSSIPEDQDYVECTE